MRTDGILGDGRRSAINTALNKHKWLVVLGVVLHAVYMLSIFDIFFKTPIVHGMDPVPPRFSAPAKRLVLLVADGLRADKFYEPDSEGGYRAPFLRSIIRKKGRWGVSHARPPTESRPGHVAIIAGFYEDPSAVTKGWKANPVEFDSVFNQSRHTFSYGSPDIVPIFCGALPHSTWSSYPHEFEDFATDASFLDEWSFDQFQNLLNRSNEDPKLKQLLQQDKLVVFLHLLGCDSNGHAHKPFSSIYLNNVKVVDKIAEKVYNLVQDYYKDNQTAYIFTADHGMSDKGSHGDGHPTNTDTPLVAWGAGVGHPLPISRSDHHENTGRFIDDHLHDTETPSEWGLSGMTRLDVNQADIAPLMSTLLGLPCPVNSVGNLPLQYMNLNKAEEVEAVLANTKQILNQVLRKSQLKQSTSLYTKPFKPLASYSSVLRQIEHLISLKEYETAMKQSEQLRSLALQGLHYFQTYDWLMLMTVITLGYVGWMIYVILHVLQSYTSLPANIFCKEQVPNPRSTVKVHLLGGLLMGVACTLLLVEKSPPLYHAYVVMTMFLWTQIFSEYRFLKALCRYLCGKVNDYYLKLIATCVFSVVILELLVKSFTERKLYTWCFLTTGVAVPFYLYRSLPMSSGIPIFVWMSCWFLSVFTLMPPQIPENTMLVVAGAMMIITIGVVLRYVELHAKDNRYWLSLVAQDSRKLKFPLLFHLQILLVGLASLMVWLSTTHRTEKQELLVLHQLVNWSIAGFSMILPLFSSTGLLSRLTSIFLGVAPPFLLLSIGYEAVFYGALGLALIAWILVENAYLHISKFRLSSTPVKSMEDDNRCLELSDMRIPLTFMVFFNIAFFGTGNFASIASFEISSVYRFITVFSPFLMAALLIFKLLIPFILVICTFSAITKLVQVPLLGCYFLVILCSDVMTIHFFFLVKNKGSWMEIGNSISHFGIMSAQVVFVLMLFAVTNIFTKDIQVRSAQQFSRKKIAFRGSFPSFLPSGGPAPQGSCPSSAKEITSLQTQLFEAVSKLQEILHLQDENQKVTREIRPNDSAILAFANKLKGAERGLDNLVDDYSDYRHPKPAKLENDTEESSVTTVVTQLKLSNILSYAHRISYTTFAPPEFGGGQAPLRGALPQDEQMRASQLYNFADLDVGLPETDEGKENILEPLIEPPAESNPLANLSAIQGLLPPPGWKPGMPVELPTDLPLPPPGWKPGDPIALPPVDSLPLQKRFLFLPHYWMTSLLSNNSWAV
ncbi:hypothetical protein K7X08_018895 [Anisodus acutangulus]|uniref:GPI ethanolamine phosphate transferase 1 n=1 Tax=Anisodus acutangulus TaxID=402998 RepID=A0A9Q1LWY7_9SOLA|nr:hypothetical protein K7X08_018895 [Anisodus acutangulus]